jgi:hypothetical protein
VAAVPSGHTWTPPSIIPIKKNIKIDFREMEWDGMDWFLLSVFLT